MTEFRKTLNSCSTNLAWSQWTELGVRGVERHHSADAIDPEALIVFTSKLSDIDPRLRDEAIDWCIKNWKFISASRLKNLIKIEDNTSILMFYEFSATVNDHSLARWPCSEKCSAFKYKPSRKSSAPQLNRPALIGLRLRGLFGVGARADIVKTLLLDQADTEISAADLARLVNFTKRNVTNILDDLKNAGLIKTRNVGNQIRYKVSHRKELQGLLGELPEFAPRWNSIYRILSGLIRIAHIEDQKPERVIAVEANKLLRSLNSSLEDLHISPPALRSTSKEYWRDFVVWAIETAQKLTSSTASTSTSLE